MALVAFAFGLAVAAFLAGAFFVVVVFVTLPVVEAFFAAGFLAVAVFFAGAFFGAAAAVVDFLVVVAFLAAGFLAVAFFAAGFLAAGFFAAMAALLSLTGPEEPFGWMNTSLATPRLKATLNNESKLAAVML